MKISGVKFTGGIKLNTSGGPGPTPSGPSKFVVGAYGYDSQKGAAYVYNTDGTGEVKITASDAGANELFGYGVGMSSIKVVVGAPFNDASGDETGAVYVYNTDGTGEQMIVASDGGAGDFFGATVAMSDTHIVVGAQRTADAGSMSGSAYVYNLDGTGEVKITPSDGASGDNFGRVVSVTPDNKIVVGSPSSDPAAGQSAGKVYTYNLDGSGETIYQPDTPEASAQFGHMVAG